MDLQAQAGPASRSRGWAVVAWTLAVGLLGAGKAWADIQVHVMNCTNTSITVETFDAKDSNQSIAYSKKTLKNKGDTATLSCEGQGKGYCHTNIEMGPELCQGSLIVSGGYVEFNLDSGKWAVVTGGKLVQQACTPVVEENLVSAPSSCN
jgi:hypothetical protein